MSASQCTVDDDACKGGEQAEWVFSTASASVFAGAIMGQLTVSNFLIITMVQQFNAFSLSRWDMLVISLVATLP